MHIPCVHQVPQVLENWLPFRKCISQLHDCALLTYHSFRHRAAIRRLSTVPCPPMTNTDNYFLACQPVSAIIGNIGTQVRIQRRVRTLICESPLPIERLCTVIEKFKVEQMTALMWTLLELARSSVVDRFDMSSLKFILSGGQHVPDPVRETIKKRLDTDLVSIYGGTEAWIVSSKSLGDNVPKGMIQKKVDL